MRRAAVGFVLTAAVALAVVALAPYGSSLAAASEQSAAAQLIPSCSLSMDRVLAGARLARKTVAVRVRCNYRVTALGLRSSIPIRKVRRVAALVGGGPGDQLTCGRRWPPAAGIQTRRAKRGTLGGCVGSTGFNTRSTITVAVKKEVCRPKRLRVRVVAFGGFDCRGSLYPCPAVGFYTSRLSAVAGC